MQSNGEVRVQGDPSVWCIFPCQRLRTVFGLPSTELLARWEQAVVNEKRENSQEDLAWIEGWVTVVSMAPVFLTELSCKMNLRSQQWTGEKVEARYASVSANSGDRIRLINENLPL